MATCCIRWAILWSTESIKIRQNQKDFGVFGEVFRVKQLAHQFLESAVVSDVNGNLYLNLVKVITMNDKVPLGQSNLEH